MSPESGSYYHFVAGCYFEEWPVSHRVFTGECVSRRSSGAPIIIRRAILVTGGAGFLGSHLCDRLIADGHDVICVDNLLRNVEHLIGHPHFEFMRHDVTFPLYIEVDEIYLACPASQIHYQRDPVQTTKTSVHGAINMLGLAKHLKCRIFQDLDIGGVR